MSYVDPITTALQQGGSTANQSASVASQFMRNSISSFNTAGSLSMKMVALLDQEEARKSQQLLQQTQLMHNIYQDNIANQMKQQQLQNQQEYQNNMLDINRNKLELDNKLTNAKIKSLNIPEGISYKTIQQKDPYTGEEKIYFYNPKDPTKLIPANSNNLQLQEPTNNNTNNSYNIENEIKKLPYSYQKIFFNKKNLNGKTPVEKYSYFKTLVGSNIDPLKFINTVDSNDVNQLKELYTGTDKNDLITNGEFLKKIDNGKLNVIKSINPNMYSNIIDFIKRYSSNVIDIAIQHGNTEAVNDLNSYLKQTLGSDYKKLGFEDMFKNKQPIVKQVNNEYNTLGDMNYDSIQDETGIAGNFVSRMFYGYNKNILNSAIRSSGTPALTKAMYYLDGKYLTSIPEIKKLFTNDALFNVANNATKKSSIFADEVNTKYLDPEVKNIINSINNKFKEQYIGTEKFNKDFTEFNKNNKNFNYDTKQTMPYELYKTNKEFEPDLTKYYNKLVNVLKEPKYYNNLTTVNNYITKNLIELKKLYPNKNKEELYNTALRDAVTNIGKDNVTKAIIYNKILIKALAARNYKGN